MRRLTCFLFLIFCGCIRSSSHYEYTERDEQGRPKPRVLLSPIYPDCRHKELSEFTDQRVRRCLLNDGKFYSVFEDENALFFDGIPIDCAFGGDLAFSEKFRGFDYVVLWEFVTDLDSSPHLLYKEPNLLATDIREYGVRLRIIDIRSRQPKLILQEVFSSRHWMTQQKGAPSPTSSELLACDRFSRTIATRIEEVIASSF